MFRILGLIVAVVFVATGLADAAPLELHRIETECHARH